MAKNSDYQYIWFCICVWKFTNHIPKSNRKIVRHSKIKWMKSSYIKYLQYIMGLWKESLNSDGQQLHVSTWTKGTIITLLTHWTQKLSWHMYTYTISVKSSTLWTLTFTLSPRVSHRFSITGGVASLYTSIVSSLYSPSIS